MRHVPTSLYIDTDVFYSHGLRFDIKELSNLTNTFTKGGLRLLVPVIMERELLRHIKQKAKEVTNSVIKAHEAYPIKNLALVELPSREELKKKCIEEMERQWSSFKEHFLVESLPITDNIEEIFDWYFQILPPFSEGKKKEFQTHLLSAPWTNIISSTTQTLPSSDVMVTLSKHARAGAIPGISRIWRNT